MAYEDMTYEVILHRMMDRVTADYPNLDTREGSILFNALAPAAVELAIAYTELDNIRNESFVKTATREYLLLACEEMGMDISVFEASAGVHKGEFNVEVAIGSRWNCDLYNYKVTSLIKKNLDTGYYEYRMECDTLGTAPNNQVGDLIAITEIPVDLTYAKVTECLIPGENETSDEDIRTSYSEYVNDVATDGNIGQYKRWCSEYAGISAYKILPLWNGANTVKVSILSTNTAGYNDKASDTLVTEFQDYLDPGVTGMGDGVAPIGAFVTVSTATEHPVTISATVKLKDGYDDVSVIDTALKSYFSKVAYEKTIIPYMSVGAAILDADGVEFITNLLINGSASDIVLGDEEIVTIEETTWAVSE